MVHRYIKCLDRQFAVHFPEQSGPCMKMEFRKRKVSHKQRIHFPKNFFVRVYALDPYAEITQARKSFLLGSAAHFTVTHKEKEKKIPQTDYGLCSC